MPPNFDLVGWHIVIQMIKSIGWIINPFIYVFNCDFIRKGLFLCKKWKENFYKVSIINVPITNLLQPFTKQFILQEKKMKPAKMEILWRWKRKKGFLLTFWSWKRQIGILSKV